MPRRVSVPVLVELGAKRCFVRALDWPGWCRSAKTEIAALDALSDYAQRYREVTQRAGVKFPVAFALEVVHRAPGTTTTEFGAPDARVPADHLTLAANDLNRWVALLQSAWATLDTVAASSSEELTRGPRGGGRDRTAMLAHVLEGERAYAPKIGVRWKKCEPDDAVAVSANREAVVAALRQRPQDSAWPVRYWIHRETWHVLDHAWEMEDKQIHN